MQKNLLKNTKKNKKYETDPNNTNLKNQNRPKNSRPT